VRDYSVLKTACLAPCSRFVALEVRRGYPEKFATSTANSSLDIPCKRVGQVNHYHAAGGGHRRRNGESAETFSAPAAVIIAKESGQVLLTPEPFVSADEAAQFLCVKRCYLLELSRRGIAGAYALGTGGKRKIWVFRLSELAVSVIRNETSIPKPAKPCTIGSGSPR
jgi:hypothetical protein